jgi:hypothetical protein
MRCNSMYRILRVIKQMRGLAIDLARTTCSFDSLPALNRLTWSAEPYRAILLHWTPTAKRSCSSHSHSYDGTSLPDQFGTSQLYYTVLQRTHDPETQPGNTNSITESTARSNCITQQYKIQVALRYPYKMHVGPGSSRHQQRVVE